MRAKTRLFVQPGALFLVLLTIAVGCASGASGPVEPPVLSEVGQASGSSANTDLWGLYDIACDPDTHEITVLPLRGADFALNVVKFLSGPSPLVKVSEADFSQWLSEGIIKLTVSITHPFTNKAVTGFDVMGVVIGNGSIQGNCDTAILYAGDNDTRLLNADGYTPWFNPVEFTTPGIFGYLPGPLGSKGVDFTATINGYKYFADGLGKEDKVEDYYSVQANLDNRGAFFPNTSNSRRYEIGFPVVAGTPKLKFQYAVVAHWESAGVESPDPSDFPAEANCAEAFYIVCNASESTTWHSGAGQGGGDIIMYLTIYDQQPLVTGGDVVDEISEICLDSYTGMLPGNTKSFSQADLKDGMQYGSGENWATFLITIPNVEPTQQDWEELLITVESQNPTTYEPPPPSKAAYPPGHLAGYCRGMVPVAPCEPPPNGVFVAPADQGGADTNSGDFKHPVEHLSTALQKAEAGGIKSVYVAVGDYTEDDTVALVDGISIYGACDPELCWAQKPSVVKSKVTFTKQNMYGAIYGQYITSPTTVSQVEFTAAAGTLDAPNSTVLYLDSCAYDVSAGGLEFISCTFKSLKGADGSPGENGAKGAKGEDGSPGENGCLYDPPFGCNCAQPIPGEGGGTSQNFGGKGGLVGYSSSQDGGQGKPGSCGAQGGAGGEFQDPEDPFGVQDGDAGADGANASVVGAHGGGGNGQGSVQNGIWQGAIGENGGNGGCGCGGSGGGGGGGGHRYYGLMCEGCQTYGGAGGGGGAGGYGGEGAQEVKGGGGSFCVFLSNAYPRFKSCTFMAGSGGQGGAGGVGGLGGEGGEPGSGGARASGEFDCTDPSGGYPHSGNAGRGGLGGAGGAGGHGGGGGGGVSYCVYRYLGSNPTIDSDCIFMPGEGGAGGTAPSGGNQGETGDSGDIY